MGAVHSKIKLANSKQSKVFDEKKDLLLQEKKKNIIKHFSTQEVTISSAVKFPSTNNDIDFFHEHHFVLKSIWSTNYSSPIKEVLDRGGARVLDVVCVAGTFLLELSNEHQNCEFFGIDKTNLFPKEIKPHNLKFSNVDILEGIPFQENYFDFVHLNITEPIFYLHQWDFIVKELLRVTKPGGYVEIQGFDYEDANFGPKLLSFMDIYILFFETNGDDMRPRDHIKSLFNTYDFETQYFDSKLVPIGKFGGNLGSIIEQHSTMFFNDAIGDEIAKLMNVDADEYNRRWEEVIEELDERKSICTGYRIWGMKRT